VRARSRNRGNNTAPILQTRVRQTGYQQQTNSPRQKDPHYLPITNGNVASLQVYRNGHYYMVRHTPYSYNNCGYSMYTQPRDFHLSVGNQYIYKNWIYYPTPYQYQTGFHCMDGYPYYVYNGYRHRYSEVDLCNYDLYDQDDKTIIKTYYGIECKKAFDLCSAKRDQLNDDEAFERYNCVERVDDDLAQANVDNIPSLINHKTPQEIEAIKTYLKESKESKIFKDGADGLGVCKIKKVDRTKNNGCNYLIEVKGKGYPMLNNSVCSNSDRSHSRSYGCDTSSQKVNATCLLALAVAEGYCF
jgi:hypothetical protein